jgi:FKBP-type peptidyl-prolyl cis-trans isomerase
MTSQAQAQSASQSHSAPALPAASAAASSAPTDALSPAARAKASHSIGLQFGTSLKRLGLSNTTISMADLEKGIHEALGGKELKREDLEPADSYLMALHQVAADANLKKAKTFLAANAKKPGVTTTQSGLQYKVVQSGQGDPPKATDRVSIYYTGKFLDGTEFDGTDKHGGQPYDMPVGNNTVLPAPQPPIPGHPAVPPPAH